MSCPCLKRVPIKYLLFFAFRLRSDGASRGLPPVCTHHTPWQLGGIQGVACESEAVIIEHTVSATSPTKAMDGMDNEAGVARLMGWCRVATSSGFRISDGSLAMATRYRSAFTLKTSYCRWRFFLLLEDVAVHSASHASARCQMRSSPRTRWPTNTERSSSLPLVGVSPPCPAATSAAWV